MSVFYFSFTFETKYGNRYFLPLMIRNEDVDVVSNCFIAMKTGLSSKFKITTNSTPIRIIKDVNEVSIMELFEKTKQCKISILNATEWKFTSFTPDLAVSFNGNMSQDIEYKLSEYTKDELVTKSIELAELVHRYRFPVQLISNADNWSDQEFLAIELVSVI